MLTRDELEARLSLGYEGRGFELKGAGRSDEKPFFAKVVRASLSLGNLRDGGHVVVGVDDEAPAELRPGLTEDDLATWAYDVVADRLATYADPPLRFDLAVVALTSGARVVVIEIHEFEDLPHLCAKALEPDLRKGALYVRSRKKPETTEVASSIEMREVLDLAAEKRLRAFVEATARAGGRLVPTSDKDQASDEAAFLAQERQVWDD